MARKKLLEILAKADDLGFLQLVWATHNLQSDKPYRAADIIRHSPEHATKDEASPFKIRPWELDTLATVLLSTKKATTRAGQNKRLRHDTFMAMAAVVNALRHLEETEDEIFVSVDNIVDREMGRIAHRTFHWQHSYFHPEALYRTLFVYGHPNGKEYFWKKYGVSLDDFTKVGVMLYFEFLRAPWFKDPTFTQLTQNKELLHRVLRVMSLPLQEMRTASSKLQKEMKLELQSPSRFAYLPSVLTKYPIVFDRESGSYIAPLPSLLIKRITTGLYYDFIDGDQATVLQEVRKNFEKYVAKLMLGFLPELQIIPEVEFGPKGSKLMTPDVLVLSKNNISLVIECKTTKNTYTTQFSDDLSKSARQGTEQLTKGIIQIWRFFSAVRRGIYDAHAISPDVRGVVLTMDDWLPFADKVHRTIKSDALKIAIEKYPEVIEADRRNVVICNSQSFSETLSLSDEAGLYATIDAATTEDFAGWTLPVILKKINRNIERKPFPLNMNEVIPWRADLE